CEAVRRFVEANTACFLFYCVIKIWNCLGMWGQPFLAAAAFSGGFCERRSHRRKSRLKRRLVVSTALHRSNATAVRLYRLEISTGRGILLKSSNIRARS